MEAKKMGHREEEEELKFVPEGLQQCDLTQTCEQGPRELLLVSPASSFPSASPLCPRVPRGMGPQVFVTSEPGSILMFGF